MRNLLVALIASALLALGLICVTTPAAVAAGHVTGRLVDSESGAPVKGQTVRLRVKASDGSPGAVIDSSLTSDTGHFDLNSFSNPAEEYYVQLLAGRYQRGHLGDEFVEGDYRFATTFGGGSDTGTIKALPAFIRGVVTRTGTLRGVGGVRVTARSANDLTQVEGGDTTNGQGVFEITGLECEDDCYLRVNGTAVNFENGYRACNASVVKFWGNACASPIGRIGRVFLDHN